MASEKQYGVTPPLSTQLPSEDQKQAADALLQELHSQGTFESAAETAKRYEVLASIQAIADAFVRKVAQEKEPDNPTLIKDARARVFTYGSFRLGVYGPGSDIDTLVVAPRYVTRVEYFKYFPDLLRKMSPPGAITELAAVEDAFVPIIKFEYSGISIDLIFSRIATLKQLPGEKDWNLKDSNLLRGLDEAELRSVNGTRVTDEIVDLVPEQKTFRDALRAVKLWAQRKAIYANIMGFPGGVAWAMMVARVCQLYPKATSAVIVSKFFGILLQWPWPNPVLLKNIESGPLQARVWNPKIYKGDGFHLMPIITPAYPSMCATFNITRSSMTVIQRELSLAADLCQKIMAGIRPWSALFTRHTFFTQDYKYYISVIASSTDKEAHVKWAGFVESKVRLLVQGLERHQSIVLARPFNKGYERTNLCTSPEGVEEVKNGSLAYVVKKEEETVKAEATHGNGTQAKTEVKVDSTSEAKTEVKTEVKTEDGPLNVKPEDGADAAVKLEDVEPQGTEVYTTTHYIGIELVEKAKSLDLSYQVNEFKDLCFAWELYRNELHKTCTVNIQHVRNFTLPGDVFEAGEVKPTKPVKKRNAPATAQATDAANSKKRTASEPQQEQHNPPKRQQTTVAAG